MVHSKTLLSKILRRNESFLQQDIANHSPSIRDKVSKSRILVIGAAGSIGSAFVRELLPFHPRLLHLVDISENNLVESVRDLRSGGFQLPNEFQTFAIDFGQIEMNAILDSQTYDYILNFAALKHVRSERDPYTLMRLLEVNILANQRLISYLCEKEKTLFRIFAVSSDKAVRPGNIMGASKSFMERVFLSSADQLSFSSARFANVAFSDGSLLHGFQKRIEKRQPLSAPNDIRRYFISASEAGQLCLLGCFSCENREIVYPLFEPEKDLMTFSDIAREYLKANDLAPVECNSEDEAKSLAKDLTDSSKKWPCYFSSSDTSGEKPCEEFVNPGEKIDNTRFNSVGVITSPNQSESIEISNAIEDLKNYRTRGHWSKENLKNIVRRVVPEMRLVSGTRNLDEKM